MGFRKKCRKAARSLAQCTSSDLQAPRYRVDTRVYPEDAFSGNLDDVRALVRAHSEQGKTLSFQQLLGHATHLKSAASAIESMIGHLEQAHHRARTEYRQVLVTGCIKQVNRLDRQIETAIREYVDKCRFFIIISNALSPIGPSTEKIRSNLKSYFREKQRRVWSRFREVQSLAKMKHEIDIARCEMIVLGGMTENPVIYSPGTKKSRGFRSEGIIANAVRTSIIRPPVI